MGAGVPDADLAALAAVEGLTVRVGGLVVDLTSDGFTLDDGTAIGVVVLTGSAADLAPLIEPADAINVIGRVERRPASEPDGEDGFVVVVDDPAGVTLGADLGAGPAALSDPAPSTAPSLVAGPADVRIAAFGDPLAGIPGAGAGLASLLLVAVASVVMTWLRRRHARTLLDSSGRGAAGRACPLRDVRARRAWPRRRGRARVAGRPKRGLSVG